MNVLTAIPRKINFQILSSFHLKNIALLTMIIDHIGSVFYPDIIGFRIIGRTSFILYAFLLANGCSHTSNLSRYIKKLVVWGFLSEIPFDLVFNDAFFSLKSQNIFFTLSLGAIGIGLFKKHKNILLRVLILSIGMGLAYLLKVDYSWYGVGLIYGLYLLKKQDIIKFGFIQGFSAFYAICCLNLMQIFAFIGIIPLYFYNGKIGRKSGTIYYSYYALHLFLFYIIKVGYDYYSCQV